MTYSFQAIDSICNQLIDLWRVRQEAGYFPSAIMLELLERLEKYLQSTNQTIEQP